MAELGARLSAREFDQWVAFLHEEPLGPFSELQRHAQLMAAQANGPLRRDDKRVWAASDFVRTPWQALCEEPASNEPSFAQIKAQAAAMFRPLG